MGAGAAGVAGGSRGGASDRLTADAFGYTRAAS
jgi:hypothetical protein